MAKRTHELPDLAAGQVWQCRDQKFEARIRRTGFERAMSFKGRIYRAGLVEGPDWYYSNEYISSDGTAYKVHTEEGEQDLVMLIYDPADQVEPP